MMHGTYNVKLNHRIRGISKLLIGGTATHMLINDTPIYILYVVILLWVGNLVFPSTYLPVSLSLFLSFSFSR